MVRILRGGAFVRGTRPTSSQTALRFAVCLVVFALLGVATASAGTVYVTLVSNETVNGTTYETELRVSNPTNQPRVFSALFLRTARPNVDRPAQQQGSEFSVPPGTTRVFRGLNTAGANIGMLEISAENELIFSARLVPKRGGNEFEGAQIPIVSSDTLVRGGNTMHLQGWKRGNGQISSFGLLNLSQTTNSCRVEIEDFQGKALMNPITLKIEPLLHAHWTDVLDIIDVTSGSEIRAEVTCTKEAYAYGLILDPESGGVETVQISQSGASALRVPGAKEECPPGALCFEEPGIFHVPQPGNDVWKKDYPIAPGQTFKVLRLNLRFQHGGWDRDSGGIHNLFWISRNVWRSNNFGYVNARGPNRNEVTNVTNVDLPAGVTKRTVASVALVPGQTYDLEYTYDTRAGVIRTQIRNAAGNLVVDMRDSTSTPNIKTQGAGFFIECGLHRIFQEVPTHGWVYQDLRWTLEP